MSRSASLRQSIQPVRRCAETESAPDAKPRDHTAEIAEAITQAIVERRLMPGTKLAEETLADLFQVSRTIVRQALHQLSRDKLVHLAHGRGARVAEPSLADAREVFEVRRVLEVDMVKRAALQFTAEDIAHLRQHLQQEHEALVRTDVPGRTRLLADFHVVIASLLGNQTLADILQELLSRSSLIALMYQSAHSAEHSWREHVALVDALARRDAGAAACLMASHLRHIQQHLKVR